MCHEQKCWSVPRFTRLRKTAFVANFVWKIRIPIEMMMKGAIVFGMISLCVRGIAPRRVAQAVTLRVHATSQAQITSYG